MLIWKICRSRDANDDAPTIRTYHQHSVDGCMFGDAILMARQCLRDMGTVAVGVVVCATADFSTQRQATVPIDGLSAKVSVVHFHAFVKHVDIRSSSTIWKVRLPFVLVVEGYVHAVDTIQTPSWSCTIIRIITWCVRSLKGHVCLLGYRNDFWHVVGLYLLSNSRQIGVQECGSYRMSRQERDISGSVRCPRTHPICRPIRHHQSSKALNQWIELRPGRPRSP